MKKSNLFRIKISLFLAFFWCIMCLGFCTNTYKTYYKNHWSPGGVQVESTKMWIFLWKVGGVEWTPWTPGGVSGVHLESIWSPGRFGKYLAGLPARKLHMDSTWTPKVHVESGGVHMESMGEGKVLRNWPLTLSETGLPRLLSWLFQITPDNIEWKRTARTSLPELYFRNIIQRMINGTLSPSYLNPYPQSKGITRYTTRRCWLLSEPWKNGSTF